MSPKTSAYTYPVLSQWVPDMGLRHPRISQDFEAPGHLGADIMFERLLGESELISPGNNKWCIPRDTRIVALAPGRVVYAKLADNGYRVRIAHGTVDGRGPIDSVYLHMPLPPLVKEGQIVTGGQALGHVGADPTDPEGLPHLHFEVRTNSGPIDPAPILARAEHRLEPASPSSGNGAGPGVGADAKGSRLRKVAVGALGLGAFVGVLSYAARRGAERGGRS